VPDSDYVYTGMPRDAETVFVVAPRLACERTENARAYMKQRLSVCAQFWVNTCGIQPLLDFCNDRVAGQPPHGGWAPNPGVAWLIIWLLMFSTAYMTVAKPAEEWGWALPSRLTLLCSGAMLGILQVRPGMICARDQAIVLCCNMMMY
jgi:hypothetical protein